MATDDLVSTSTSGSTGASAELPIRSSSATAISPPEPQADSAGDFDIVATYHRLLADDPELTMPVAAIEAMIAVLGHTSSSTVMETMKIVREQAERLRNGVANPMPLTAGTELFQTYLLRSLKQQTSHSHDGGSSTPTTTATTTTASPLDSFEQTRQHLLKNGKLFAARAKAARDTIADKGARYVRDGGVVLTAGGSRTVRALLLRAADRHIAETGHPRFEVLYVRDERFPRECEGAVAALRGRGVPVTELSERAVAYAMQAGGVDTVFVGTEVVVQNGGLISRMGSLQLAALASVYKRKFYVVAETHKFMRGMVLGQDDLPRLGIKQNVLGRPRRGEREPAAAAAREGSESLELSVQEHVDYTPPNLITGILTEQGSKLPSQVYEMILDMHT
ncbi:uncharacterized protein E0L32_010675 [Thyridium curvatum]|uniref:Translation initiation factor eIF2B subunit alpha n=1 Tax=Thyridium curvatum TaxID=1093900 RepID=A0A507AKW0_9PEZI|nr:uncharacterized protein E0L32_010675 [Thyridium curvatum]TPX07677.1 hypothetical protein E0L32_010675 [Thyridium curvatum]